MRMNLVIVFFLHSSLCVTRDLLFGIVMEINFLFKVYSKFSGAYSLKFCVYIEIDCGH